MVRLGLFKSCAKCSIRGVAGTVFVIVTDEDADGVVGPKDFPPD